MKLPPGPLTADDISVLSECLEMVKDIKGVYVEIGSLVGRSSVLIGSKAKEARARLYCIDVWDSGKWGSIASEIGEVAGKYPERPADVYKQFCGNIKNNGLSDTVETIIERSDVAFKTWTLPIRFLFVDGCHEYSFVKSDAMWKRFITVGGLIVFHDYHVSWPGVIKAVNEVLVKDSGFKIVFRGNQTIAFQRVGFKREK